MRNVLLGICLLFLSSNLYADSRHCEKKAVHIAETIERLSNPFLSKDEKMVFSQKTISSTAQLTTVVVKVRIGLITFSYILGFDQVHGYCANLSSLKRVQGNSIF